jgi:hypothetical protein
MDRGACSGQGHESRPIVTTVPVAAKGEPTQAVTQCFRSDCQQISAQPRDRNASWISGRLGQSFVRLAAQVRHLTIALASHTGLPAAACLNASLQCVT